MSAAKAHSIAECAGHILWTLDHSPSSYAYSREALVNLRQALVNAELKFREGQPDKTSG